MYAANGQYKIPYIDCLFLCFSCMCVTGLAPTNLSQLTVFQQFLLFAQTLMGSLVNRANVAALTPDLRLARHDLRSNVLLPRQVQTRHCSTREEPTWFQPGAHVDNCAECSPPTVHSGSRARGDVGWWPRYADSRRVQRVGCWSKEKEGAHQQGNDQAH